MPNKLKLTYNAKDLWEALMYRNKGLSYSRLAKHLEVKPIEARKMVYASLQVFPLRTIGKVLANKVVNLPRALGGTYTVLWRRNHENGIVEWEHTPN